MRLVPLRSCVAALVLASSLFPALSAFSMPVHLRTEQSTNPIGIDVDKPVFS